MMLLTHHAVRMRRPSRLPGVFITDRVAATSGRPTEQSNDGNQDDRFGTRRRGLLNGTSRVREGDGTPTLTGARSPQWYLARLPGLHVLRSDHK